MCVMATGRARGAGRHIANFGEPHFTTAGLSRFHTGGNSGTAGMYLYHISFCHNSLFFQLKTCIIANITAFAYQRHRGGLLGNAVTPARQARGPLPAGEVRASEWLGPLWPALTGGKDVSYPLTRSDRVLLRTQRQTRGPSRRLINVPCSTGTAISTPETSGSMTISFYKFCRYRHAARPRSDPACTYLDLALLGKDRIYQLRSASEDSVDVLFLRMSVQDARSCIPNTEY